MEGGVSLPAGAVPPGRAATDNWSRVTLKLRPGTHQTPWAARGRLPAVEFVWLLYTVLEKVCCCGNTTVVRFGEVLELHNQTW